VHVFDAQGLLVFSERLNASSSQIDLSKLSVGPYFVRISNKTNGHSRHTVIVER
jgi:hypothetical protein